MEVRVGTAGWSIPSQYATLFPAAGTHLERYAKVFSAVEINSSFYRPHRPATYARWAASVPDDFRFAVKVPRAITHERRLLDIGEPLGAFLSQIESLGEKLGPLLIQLPPSLNFSAGLAEPFFEALRRRFAGDAVCEPRHASWFTGEADRLLQKFKIARVAADPPPVPEAAKPGGWTGLVYRRLHGAPKIYYSAYAEAIIAATAALILPGPAPNWCIFDNTARGEAARNALQLARRLALYRVGDVD